MPTKSVQSISERAMPRRQTEERDRTPDFVCRVRTGPGRKDWGTIGYAWQRDNGEGFSLKLNTLPIGNDWKGVIKLLPPYMAEEDMAPEDGM